MDATGFVEVRDRIVEVAETMDFSEIEEEIITPADLPEIEKAALWLFAWSYVPDHEQRYLALELAEHAQNGHLTLG